MRTHRITSAVVVGALGLSLAACGSSSDAMRTRDLSGARRIVTGYDAARSESTVRMDGEVQVRVQGRDMAVPLDGAIDFAHDAARFTISLDGLGLPALGDASLEARLVDGHLYVNAGALVGSLLGGRWVEVPVDAMGGATTDPTRLLDALRGVTEVERVGTDTIRGVEAIHYRGTISVADAIGRAPADRRERLRRALGAVDATIPVDVWVDGRDRPVRFAASFESAPVAATLRLDLFDYGADVTVTAPPADEVTSLGGLLGGTGGVRPSADGASSTASA